MKLTKDKMLTSMKLNAQTLTSVLVTSGIKLNPGFLLCAPVFCIICSKFKCKIFPLEVKYDWLSSMLNLHDPVPGEKVKKQQQPKIWIPVVFKKSLFLFNFLIYSAKVFETVLNIFIDHFCSPYNVWGVRSWMSETSQFLINSKQVWLTSWLRSLINYSAHPRWAFPYTFLFDSWMDDMFTSRILS